MDYEAFGVDGVQHVEHTIVSPGALYVAHSEAMGVQVFTETSPGVFDASTAGPDDQRLVLDWDGEVLSWSWHWAPAGQELCEQSRAVAHLVDR